MIGPGISPKLGIRGVLAYEPILQGTIIEIPPYLIIPDSEVDTIRTTIFNRYVFNTELGVILLLGLGSLYNHSSLPNAKVITRGSRVLIEATENIGQGEEITISYSDQLEDLAKYF